MSRFGTSGARRVATARRLGGGLHQLPVLFERGHAGAGERLDPCDAAEVIEVPVTRRRMYLMFFGSKPTLRIESMT